MLSISLGVLFALALLLIITRVVSYALEVEFQSRKHGHADPMATICAERKRGLFLAALADAGTSVGKRVISEARAMADITSAKGRSHTFDARVGEPHLRKTVGWYVLPYGAVAGIYYGTWDGHEHIRKFAEGEPSRANTPTSRSVNTLCAAIEFCLHNGIAPIFKGPRPDIVPTSDGTLALGMDLSTCRAWTLALGMETHIAHEHLPGDMGCSTFSAPSRAESGQQMEQAAHSSGGSFQIFFIDLSGRSHTLDGVQVTDSGSTVLRRIMAKLGHSEASTSECYLVREGKCLEFTDACGLSQHSTVHLTGRIDGGTHMRLRRRPQTESARSAALPDAPCVNFYQGKAHGDCRIAELAWYAWMTPDKGKFADPWVSWAQRADLPPHLGVIVTYVEIRSVWCATTVVTEAKTQPGEWGLYSTRHLTGGECIGFMLDTTVPSGPSRYLVKLRSGVRDGASCRPGGPKRANDPKDTGLPANAILYDNGVLAVRPFMTIEPLRPELSLAQGRSCEVMFHYGRRYWRDHERTVSALPPVPVVSPPVFSHVVSVVSLPPPPPPMPSTYAPVST